MRTKRKDKQYLEERRPDCCRQPEPGGGIDPVYNAINVGELAIEKAATTLLIPISARRQLNDLADEMATKLVILYFADAREALVKALNE